MKATLGRLLALGSAAAAAALMAACGGMDVVGNSLPGAYRPAPGSLALSTTTPASLPIDAQITASLIKIVDRHSSFVRNLSSATTGTPEGDLLLIGSPIGYNLRNRFLDIGIPLAEAFAGNTDPAFRAQLVDMSRWENDDESRAAALIALARWHDIGYLQVFNEALINPDPGVRFAALESLVVWGFPRQAEVLLAAASERDPQPLLRVYAAAGLARLGDPAGLARLRQFLDDQSWIIKAMAARYIGELGTAEDYDILLNRVDQEVTNDFVVAEFCVSALKLFPKKKAAQQAAVPAAPVRVPSVPVGNEVIDDAMAYELDPLVVTAPRVAAQVDLIDPRINAQLMRLLRKKSERQDTTSQQDANVAALYQLTTQTGFNLQIRYTQLGYLLTEGLAGTNDYDIQNLLENTARQSKDAMMRAAALVTLAYTKDLRYQPLILGAMVDTNITVRFAALEALLIMDDPSLEIQVGTMARGDASLPVQIYAAAAMWKMGDIFGREILLRDYQNKDWLVRAMADHYLGEMGGSDEYLRLQRELDNEHDPGVKAELLAALVKLNPKKDE
ncbi:MAG: HEAT repeat domain-containing protein [Elusimicrobiota bacterium]